MNWHQKSFLGLHFDLHATKDDTSLGLETDEEHIREELLKINPDFVQYGSKGCPGYAEYPTKAGVPAPGLKKDAIKIWRNVTREIKIPFSVHYSGIIDVLAGERHPSWVAVGPEGQPRVKYDKHSVMCVNGPYIDKLMIPQFLELIDWYDVDGIWVDADCWAAQPCWCERCRELFKKETGNRRAPLKQKDSLWDEWLAFHRRSYERYVTKYTNAVHGRKPGCLVCSNWAYTLRYPDEVTIPVDYISGDVDPIKGPERACIEGRFIESRGISWDLMVWTFYRLENGLHTMKTAAHLKQEAATILANGGKLWFYDQPRRTGRLINWHNDLIADAVKFCRKRQKFFQNTVSVPQVALLHHSRYYYKNNNPLFNLGVAVKPIEGALKLLFEDHYYVDILNETALRRRMQEYPIVVIPEQTNLDKELVAELYSYVEKGGRLLVIGAEAVLPFIGLLGGNPEGCVKDSLFYMTTDKHAIPVKGRWRLLSGIKGRKIGNLSETGEIKKDHSCHPSALVINVKKGKLGMVPGPVCSSYGLYHPPFLRECFSKIVREMSLERLVETDAPPCVYLFIRKQINPSRLVIHLMNLSTNFSFSPINAGIENVLNVGPIKLKVRCAQRPNKVYLIEEDNMFQWKWKAGYITGIIDSLKIHNAVIIREEEICGQIQSGL